MVEGVAGNSTQLKIPTEKKGEGENLGKCALKSGVAEWPIRPAPGLEV